MFSQPGGWIWMISHGGSAWGPSFPMGQNINCCMNGGWISSDSCSLIVRQVPGFHRYFWQNWSAGFQNSSNTGIQPKIWLISKKCWVMNVGPVPQLDYHKHHDCDQRDCCKFMRCNDVLHLLSSSWHQHTNPLLHHVTVKTAMCFWSCSKLHIYRYIYTHLQISIN